MNPCTERIFMAVISSQRLEGLAYQFQTENHQVTVDVPEKLGGKDLAPDPHEYMEIALAACTAITLQMYAARKKIPLDSSDVSIKIVTEGASNEIERTIYFHGNLSEADKENLLTIADKCPIHKFLSAGAKITTKGL